MQYSKDWKPIALGATVAAISLTILAVPALAQPRGQVALPSRDSCNPHDHYFATVFEFGAAPDFNIPIPPSSGIIVDMQMETYAVLIDVGQSGGRYHYAVTGQLGYYC